MSEESKTQESKKSFLTSETVIIAITTLIGYFSFYGFGYGYCEYFNIPVESLAFDLSKLFLVFLGNKFFSFYVILPIALLFYLYFLVDFGKQYLYVILFLYSFILIYLIPSILEEKPFYFLRILTAVFPAILVTILAAIISYRTLPYAREKYQHSLKNTILGYLKINFEVYTKSKHLLSLTILLFSLDILLFVTISGRTSAESQVDFLVTNTTPECVVLYQVDNDTVICSPFDRNTKELEEVYKHIKMSDNKDLELRRESIGPLHPKQTATPTAKPTKTPRPTLTPKVTNTPVPTMTPSPTP